MDRYEIIKKLGAGTYGTVYLCRQTDTGRQCVMKRMVLRSLSDKERDSAHQEAEVLRNLSHPNIVAYVDALSTRSKLYLIMQFCDGGDLEQRLQALKKENGTLPDNQLLDWFVQMTLALQYLHSRRILHRDLKTANVFLTRGNIIKLGDFGVSRVLNATTELAKTFVGTPYYLSPELLNNQPYGHASDTWALGCIFYEMATLEHPFEAKNFPSLAQKILNELPVSMATYRQGATVPELEDLTGLMLEKDPTRRATLPQLLEHQVVQRRMLEFVTEAEQKSAELAAAPPPAPLQGSGGSGSRLGSARSGSASGLLTAHPPASQHNQHQDQGQQQHQHQDQHQHQHQPAAFGGSALESSTSSSSSAKRGSKKKRPPRSEAADAAGSPGLRQLSDSEKLAEIERKQKELQTQMEALQAAKTRMELASTQQASLEQFAQSSSVANSAPATVARAPPPRAEVAAAAAETAGVLRCGGAAAARGAEAPLPPPPSIDGALVDENCRRSLAEWNACFSDRPLLADRAPRSHLHAAAGQAPSCTSSSSPTPEPAQPFEGDTHAAPSGAAPSGGAPRSRPTSAGLCASALAVAQGGSYSGSNPALTAVKVWGDSEPEEAEDYEEDFEAESDGEEPPTHEDVAQTLRRISQSGAELQDGNDATLPSGLDGSGIFGSFAAGKGLLELEKTVAKLRLEVAAMDSANEENATWSSTLKEVASRLSPAVKGSQRRWQ